MGRISFLGLAVAVALGAAKKVADGSPGILDCSYSEDWNDFRETFRENAAQGFPHSEDVFNKADRLIAHNILTFLEFHRSKSNAFFHDCDREAPEGMVCLYGMLSALFVHHIYLRGNAINHAGDSGNGSQGMAEVFGLSTKLARLLIINKNNCLDFFDSSNWPLTLAQLIATLRPGDVSDELLAPILPEAKPAVWRLPGERALRPPETPEHPEDPLICYITGTHAALAREPAEMLSRFASNLLGFSIAAVMEVADETHCGFLGCAEDSSADAAILPALGLDGIGFEAVGLSDLARKHFRPRWTGLDISDWTEFSAEFQRRFRQHAMSRAMDIGVCTSPAVLCLLLLPFQKPLLGYLGEPLLLAVDGNTRNQWFQQFRSMVTAPNHFFACYNPFLSSMIEYQTALALPIIRLHGLYTQVSAGYVPGVRNEILVVKGPNICIDSVCLLNRFMQNLADPNDPSSVKFIGLDELGGAPYEVLVSFKATVLYPYDVALAIFYEMYTMCMPLLLPSEELLPFFVFRGLHSNAEFHHSDPFTPEPEKQKMNRTLPPFVPAMDPAKWFYAAGPWSSRTDFAKFPHLLRFSSVADLFSLVSNSDWSKVSRQMQRFNEETLVQSAAAWAHAVAKALSVEQL
eukprot:s892_g19.t1